MNKNNVSNLFYKSDTCDITDWPSELKINSSNEDQSACEIWILR